MLRSFSLVLLAFLFSLGCHAAHETVSVNPGNPKGSDYIQLIFAGQIDGPPITIDEVVLERAQNLLRLTVSRRGEPTGAPEGYSGSVAVGVLPIGHYEVEFYVREIGLNGTQAYGPPVLAAAMSFDVLALELPVSNFSIALLMFVLLTWGGYAARQRRFVRDSSA